jgi:hypothetical protein
MVVLATAVHADPVVFLRPGYGEGATTVNVAFLMLDIDDINTADQTFTANLFIRLRWHDERLARGGHGLVILRPDQAWRPELIFVSQQKIWDTIPDVLNVYADGTVIYRRRIWGPFSQPLYIRDFPFDSQTFSVRLACLGTLPGEVDFIADPTVKSGFAPEFSLPDWEIRDWHLDFSDYQPFSESVSVPSFALIFDAVRHSRHYLLKVILPMVLIVAMSWVVFWINPEHASTQIGVATTSMLTLIAYRFIIGTRLPPVPYLTRMDTFILWSTLIVFAALAQAVVTAQLAGRKRGMLAHRIDAWCRTLFPLIFIAMTAWTLWL